MKTTKSKCWITIGAALLLVLGYGPVQRLHNFKKICRKNHQCNELAQTLQKKQWSKALSCVQSGLSNHTISKKDIHVLACSFSNTPFSNAYMATSAILKLKKTGLAFSLLFPIALFKETQCENESFYIPEERFGRELQYDKDSNIFFIHLGTHNVKPLGKGHFKVVTKTIAYHRSHPQIYARAVTSSDIRKEIACMKELSEKKGLLSAVSYLVHQHPATKKTIYTIITPIFNQGSLQKVIDKQSLTFEEKVKIAQTILTGICAMHSKGYIHRDLGARNYLVHRSAQSINCVIADFGRCMHVSEIDGTTVQGNHYYYAPEGTFKDKMKGDMYYATDVFAAGCVFWQLYFGNLPPWGTKVKNDFLTADQLKLEYQRLYSGIKDAHKKVQTLISEKNAVGHYPESIFLEIILKMTHPDPTLRITAQEAARVLNTTLTN